MNLYILEVAAQSTKLKGWVLVNAASSDRAIQLASNNGMYVFSCEEIEDREFVSKITYNRQGSITLDLGGLC